MKPSLNLVAIVLIGAVGLWACAQVWGWQLVARSIIVGGTTSGVSVALMNRRLRRHD